MRVAAIEIGSRAVRLVIANATSSRLDILNRRVENIDLMLASRSGDGASAVDRVRLIVDEFKQHANARGAIKVMVFGTEALRRIDAEGGAASLTDVHLLSPQEEAECSYLAAVRGLTGRTKGPTLAAIDHGNGSLEIATGEDAEPPRVSSWSSLDVGSDRLVARLGEFELKLRPFRDWLDEQLKEGDLTGLTVDDLIAQGSVATKFAWINVRRNLEENYDADRVHGYRVTHRSIIDKIVEINETARDRWNELSREINPKDEPTDQVHRLVTGCLLFERLLRIFRRDSFLVSSYGTRHGLIWKTLALAASA